MRKNITLVLIVFLMSLTTAKADTTRFIEKSKVQYGADTVHTYEHNTKGMQVIWIENKDIKTCFTLGVKTPTTDSTGVNHIIEHSVFTGSEKYPSASLFFDANTIYPHIYMNASTSSDLTMFPFCTPYKESFEGLLEVYLDSILNPSMLKEPSHFYEEAFYYDPHTEKFGGVVYNEMKGANSSMGRIVFRNIREATYEGTHYANDSGGQVSEIPKLTYEEFVQTYNNYYYPENMMVVLYGDLPIDKVLTVIEGHLGKYTEDKESVEINVKPTLGEGKQTRYYEGGSGAFAVKSFVITEEMTSEAMVELDLWINAHMMDSTSYFSTMLKEKGINIVEVYKDSELKYPIYSIVVGGIKPEEVEEAEKILSDTLEEMKIKIDEEKNLEQDTIEKNRLAYYEKDQEATRGIQIAQTMISGWAHDKEWDQYYKVKAHMAQIQELPKDCEDILLGAEYVTDLRLLPSEKVEEENPLEISPIKREEWQGIVKNMRQWQADHQDSGLKEVNLKGLVIDNDIKYKKKKKEGITYTLYQTDSELIHSELYFKVDHIKQEKLPYLFLYPLFLEEAAKELSPFQGMLRSHIVAIDDTKGYTPYIKTSMLSSKNNKHQEELLKRVQEVLLEKDTRWYEEKLDSLLGEAIATFQADIIGTLNALNMAGQEGGKRYLYEQSYPLIEFCVNLKKMGNTEFVEEIKEIGSQVGPNEGSYLAFMTDKDTYEEIRPAWEAYCKENRKESLEKQNYNFTKSNKTNIYYKQTNVDYLVYSYDKVKDYIDGLDYLSATYITKNYLQPNIRIKKGAYGSGMDAMFPNSIGIFTYRDPEYQTSMDIINNMVPILKAELTKDKVEVAKSGAICDVQNQFGLLSTDVKKASVLQILTMMGMDIDYVVDMQKQIIKSDIKDITKQFEVLTEILKNSQIGICTNKATIPTQTETKMYNMR